MLGVEAVPPSLEGDWVVGGGVPSLDPQGQQETQEEGWRKIAGIAWDKGLVGMSGTYRPLAAASIV